MNNNINYFKVNNLNYKLLFLFCLLAPTSIANILPDFIIISVSKKLTVSGIAILLILVYFFRLICNFKWINSTYSTVILLYLGCVTFYFYKYIITYSPDPTHLSGELRLLGLLLISFFVFHPIYAFLKKEHLQNLINAFLLGSLFTGMGTVVIFLYILSNSGGGDLYVVKQILGQLEVLLENTDEEEIGIQFQFIGSHAVLILKFFNGLTNSVLLANLLAFSAILSFGLYLFNNNNNKKYMFLLLLFSFSSVILTQRSSILALFIGFLSMYYYYSLIKNRSLELSVLKSTLIILVLIITVLVFLGTQETLSGKLNSEGLQKEPRLTLWKNALIIFFDQPLGNGFRYIANEKIHGGGNFPFGIYFEFDNPHNTILENSLSYGLFGLILYLILVFFPIIISYRNIRWILERKFTVSNISKDISLQFALFGFPLMLVAFIGVFFTGHIFTYPSSYTMTIILFIALIMKNNYFIRRDYA